MMRTVVIPSSWFSKKNIFSPKDYYFYFLSFKFVFFPVYVMIDSNIINK
jgi:hypothetical protein